MSNKESRENNKRPEISHKSNKLVTLLGRGSASISSNVKYKIFSITYV